MIVTRNVINLKSFLGDMFVALTSKNEEDVKELDEKFSHFYKSHTSETFEHSLSFIKKQQLYIENKILQQYFSKFSM